MVDQHLSDAYWRVIGELTYEGELPQTALEKILPAFERLGSDRRKQGQLLHTTLHPLAWDWPIWPAFAAQEKYSLLTDDHSRSKAARFLAVRIGTIRHCSEQRAQMLEPEFLEMRPFWKFVCFGHRDGEKPALCAALEGTTVPHQEAMQIFPALPCNRVVCSGDIFPVTG